MTAEIASSIIPLPFDDRSDYPSKQVKGPWALSPFNEYLDVFVPLDDPRNGNVKVFLRNAGGLVIMEQNVNMSCSEISFNTESLVSGLYILCIESPGKSQILKVIKTF